LNGRVEVEGEFGWVGGRVCDGWVSEVDWQPWRA
jgi:hypothetical protein